MYIARLQLKGFKSFGGSHDLQLDPGMTAIVGPNGSGKSNMLDALRWVLGDSHASKLRVARQGGLIFHGSASVPKADEGEVAIQLREGVRVCTIRRRVIDQGSVMTVDGSRVTMTELDETKRAWGLSGDQFAFIGQGDVSEVIQQRPAARRVMLESLMGIDAYRKRRDDAAGRLTLTRDEYAKMRAFAAELASRREEIAPEVERAAQVREMLDRLEEARRLLYWTRRTRAERSGAALAASAEELAASAVLKDMWRAAWSSSLESLETRASAMLGGRDGQARDLENAKSSLAEFKRTAYGLGTSLVAAGRRLEQIASERASRSERLAKLRADRDAATAESAEIRRELDEAKARLASDTERLDSMRSQVEAARARRAEKSRELGRIDSELQTIKGRARGTASMLRDASDAVSKSRGDKDTRAIAQELEKLELEHEAALDARERANAQWNDTYARLQTAGSDLTRARRESSRLASRLAEIRDQASEELYPRPVQHILSASRLGKIKQKPCAVIDAFSCDAEIAAAMDAFLAGRQFWLLVDTMDEAGACIDLLKKNQMGRATFLPLERCRPRTPDRSRALPRSGIVGWAAELVEVVPKWRPAFDHLAGDVLIVESYDVGQSLVRSGFRAPIATLDGDVFQPGGTVSGGRSQKQGKAIEIKSQIVKLEAEAKAAEDETRRLTELREKLEQEETDASSRKDEAASALRAIAERRTELDARREAMVRERERARSERARLDAELAELTRDYAALAASRRELVNGLETEAVEAEDETLPAEIDRTKAQIALLDERARSNFVLSDRIISETRDLERRENSDIEEASELERDSIDARTSLVNLARRYAEVASQRRRAIEEMEEFSDRFEQLSKARDARRGRLDTAQAACETAHARADEEARRAAAAKREVEELVSTWEEQYPYPGADGYEDADPDALRRETRDLDRRVRDLGDVDMGVLSEDRSLRDRLSYLGSQLDDVRAGMAELERLISDADEQARTVFTTALKDIDAKFNDLFKRLFTGGDAKLELTEGDTLWDMGVDVVARPPGKRPQSISQLSGGEQSLSAIALLFASLEVANCPIAVLDEVDAALDEVNLRRFADLTKEESASRQIFVMTHRRVTMERADTLYGVTLAEPGLSQVIGVRVEDWA